MRVKKCNMNNCEACFPLTAWIDGEPRSYKCSSEKARIRTLWRLRTLHGSGVPNVFACYLCLRDGYAIMGGNDDAESI